MTRIGIKRILCQPFLNGRLNGNPKWVRRTVYWSMDGGHMVKVKKEYQKLEQASDGGFYWRNHIDK